MAVNFLKDQIISGNKFFDAVERISHFNGIGRTFKVIKSKNHAVPFLEKEIKQQPSGTLMIVLNVARVIFLPITLMAVLLKGANRFRLKKEIQKTNALEKVKQSGARFLDFSLKKFQSDKDVVLKAVEQNLWQMAEVTGL